MYFQRERERERESDTVGSTLYSESEVSSLNPNDALGQALGSNLITSIPLDLQVELEIVL